jgi:hypothetical protein
LKGTTLDRISTLRESGEAQAGDPSNETVTVGARYGAHKAIRSGAEKPAAQVDSTEARIAEEIKHRQLSLVVRYVAAMRTR